MSESKTAKQAVQAARKSKSGFDYDSSGNLPRLIPMQNGDVLFRDPTDGRTRRLTGDAIGEQLQEEFGDHPLWPQIDAEMRALAQQILVRIGEATRDAVEALSAVSPAARAELLNEFINGESEKVA